MINFSEIDGFEWDDYNLFKNWEKHSVHWTECEELFFNKPLIINKDNAHSDFEKRFYTLGQTNLQRKIFLVFTIRQNKIRVISARDMSKKERAIYEKHS